MKTPVRVTPEIVAEHGWPTVFEQALFNALARAGLLLPDRNDNGRLPREYAPPAEFSLSSVPSSGRLAFTVFVNVVHQELHVIHRRFRNDAVAQVKNMPGLTVNAFQQRLALPRRTLNPIRMKPEPIKGETPC